MKKSLTSEWSFKYSNSWKSCWTDNTYGGSFRVWSWMLCILIIECFLLIVIPLNFLQCTQAGTCEGGDIAKAICMGFPNVCAYAWSMRLHSLYKGNHRWKYCNDGFRKKLMISHMILIGTNIVALILGLTMTFGVKSSLYWALAFHVVSLALSIQFYFVMNRYLVHQKFWDETKDERE